MKDYKFSLVILVLILSIFGVFMVRSARPDFTNNQIMGVILGLAAMAVISLIDYKWVLNLYWPLYVVNLDTRAWRECQWSDPLAGYRFYPISAIGHDKDFNDPVFREIFDGPGA